MASSAANADFPSADYHLKIHDGERMTTFRLRDGSIRLAGDGIDWSIDGRVQRGALSDIRTIRLTTQVETARGPVGISSCQIRFRSGGAVMVFGGNAQSADAADRNARFEAFVTELHRRLAPGDRARIRFVAGFGAPRFYLLLGAALFFALLWLTAAVGTLIGLAPQRTGSVVALTAGAVMAYGLFRRLQRNAPHVYDPRDPLGSARAGSIVETIGQSAGDIRRGMTPKKWLVAGAIGTVAIVLVVVAVASHERVNLFSPGRAPLVFAALLARTGPHPTVTYVAVTPGEVLVETPSEDRGSSRRIDWRASRRTLFGWSEWDDISGPTTRYPMSLGEELGEEPFALQPGDGAHLDDLAGAAVARAALGPGSAVARMTLVAPHPFAADREPPRWTVEVEGPAGRATVYADRAGILFPATPAPAGPPRILITAGPGSPHGLYPVNSATWIRVIDPDQSVRFDGTLKPGDRYQVPDIRGIRLQTGKPEALSVTVDGRPAKLPVPGYGGRLDSVLDPQALLAGAERRD
ncbi:MAG: DUF4115 domain-containing protein [Reyranellaceae bacterium]